MKFVAGESDEIIPTSIHIPPIRNGRAMDDLLKRQTRIGRCWEFGRCIVMCVWRNWRDCWWGWRDWWHDRQVRAAYRRWRP